MSNDMRMSHQDKVGLQKGLTVTALSRLFKMNKVTVNELLVNVQPSDFVNGYPLYHIAEAAKKLVRPDDDRLIETIKRLKPTELPMKIRKEFWDAALSRQKYEENARELWRTVDIQELLIEVFKTMRVQINLFADNVNREVNLTNAQRELIQEMTDELLQLMSKALVERDDLARLKPTIYEESTEDDDYVEAEDDDEELI